MLRTIRKENAELAHVLVALRKAAKANDAPLWGAVAEKLCRPRRQSKPVNVGHLERLAKPKETVVIPGKLLAHGHLSKAITVAAFHYSEDARTKIHAAGGTALSIHDLLKANPDGTGVRLLA
ncbi:MAG: 50S ribosomal protein L18e [Thermoplasmata archaeon]|jgi:large subunit ribosomal protein L18e|nr:50S ribosomal protein L18e [Thermoplasmata archaeon]